jgi:phage portal protein BeeE
VFNKIIEKRSVTFQQVFGTGGFFGMPTRAGVTIDQNNSLRIATVYACIRLLTDTVSTLSLDSYRRIDGVRVPYRPRPIWLDAPDPDLASTRDEFIAQVMISLLLDGNAFIHITRSKGEVIALSVLQTTINTTRIQPIQ